MKQFLMTAIPAMMLLVFSSFTGLETRTHTNPFQIIEAMQQVPDDDDMEFYSRTTAYQWNAIAWFDHDAVVFRNKRDGSFWIKIFIIATPGYVQCRVQNNPDYTGGISGGARTSRKYLAVGNGITYYFNLK